MQSTMRTLLQLAMVLVSMMHEIVSAQTDQLDCGNTSFSGPNGVIKSPNFPLLYPHNLRCTYFIDVGRNNSVTLKFVSFELESSLYSVACAHDWLMITCNETTADERQGFNRKYCGNTLEMTSLRFFDCPVVALNFDADESINRGGFMIEYTVVENSTSADISDLDCGDTLFTDSSGVISLPTNPTGFPARVNCTYIISTNLTSRIMLHLLSLQTRQLMESFQDCNKENITIGCVSSNRETELNPSTIKTYCRLRLPVISDESSPTVFSNCRMVKLSIRSSNYNYRGTYRIPFTVVATDEICGNTSFTGPTGIITSPLFPLSYPHSLDCVYSIDTDRTKSVSFQFLTFHLEGVSLYRWVDDCDHDWLTISCSSNDSVSTLPSQIKKYCGQKTTPLILRYSNCDSMTLNFVTDSSVTAGGFQLRYAISLSDNSTSASPDEDCGITSFTGPTGVISSLGFPLSPPHSSDCVYSIEANRTKTVLLRFLSFYISRSYLDYDDDCDYDGLTISCLSNNSVSANPFQNRKFCGENRPPHLLIYSNCDSLRLHFVANTDLPVTEARFQLNYTITSRNSVEEIPDENCGYTSFTGSTGVIKSPQFPLSYPHSLNCVYSIDVDRTKTVLLNSLSFHLEGSSNHPNPDSCAYDWLTISCLSNGSVSREPSPRKYCGERQIPLILRYSNCDSLRLNFVTDSSVASGGFQLRYTITQSGPSDCGSTLFSGPNGIITSPNFPLSYPLNLSCAYSIDVGRNKAVLLNFTYFDLEKRNATGYCVQEWLMIHCNETTEVTPDHNKKYCGNIQWKTSLRFLNCPSLVLKFSGSSSTANSTGFIIDYTVAENAGSMSDSTELGCGNTLFTNSSGVISLPRNPTEYLATVNCTYTISTNQRHSTILLNVLYAQSMRLLQSFQDCNTENIMVGCVSEGETKLNPNTSRVFCNHELATTYFSSSSQFLGDCRTLKLSIRSVNYDNRETFSIPYLAVGPDEECGKTSFSAPSGIISSTELPWPYRKNVNCLYTIDGGGHAKSVVLSIDHLRLGPSLTRSDSCNSDWLMITCLVNGTSVSHPYSGRKLCGYLFQLVMRFPNCHFVLLNYSNDHTIAVSGFTVQYRMGDFDDECGNTSFTGPSGFITSPQFPLFYPHDLNCMYSIVGNPRNLILLSFLAFQLQGISRTSSTSIDYCYDSDWLTITCLSDESAAAQIYYRKKYCGLKTPPLTFTFSNCAAVLLNFVTDSSVSHGGFRLHYIVRDTDSLCGPRFHDRPSGAIKFPWNYTNYGDNFDCNYVINATENSSISLTIWSISLEGFVGENCKRDRLQITCVDGHPALNYSVSHISCDYLNSSTQTTFFRCAAVEVVFHKDATATGKTFLIEYTITRHAEDTSQPLVISMTTDIPVTRTAKCEFGCKLSEDGTTCDCATTHSGDHFASTQSDESDKSGHSVGIAVAVILLVIVAIGLVALLLYRRHRTKNRSEMLLQTNEDETAQHNLDNDNEEAGKLFAAPCSQDRGTSKYVPLRPLSYRQLSSNDSAQFNEEMQPVL